MEEVRRQCESAVMSMRTLFRKHCTFHGESRSGRPVRRTRIGSTEVYSSCRTSTFNYGYTWLKTKILDKYCETNDTATVNCLLEFLSTFNNYGDSAQSQDVPKISEEIVRKLLTQKFSLSDIGRFADLVCALLGDQGEVVGEKSALFSDTKSDDSMLEPKRRRVNSTPNLAETADDASVEMDIALPIYENISPASSRPASHASFPESDVPSEATVGSQSDSIRTVKSTRKMCRRRSQRHRVQQTHRRAASREKRSSLSPIVCVEQIPYSRRKRTERPRPSSEGDRMMVSALQLAEGERKRFKLELPKVKIRPESKSPGCIAPSAEIEEPFEEEELSVQVQVSKPEEGAEAETEPATDPPQAAVAAAASVVDSSSVEDAVTDDDVYDPTFSPSRSLAATERAAGSYRGGRRRRGRGRGRPTGKQRLPKPPAPKRRPPPPVAKKEPSIKEEDQEDSPDPDDDSNGEDGDVDEAAPQSGGKPVWRMTERRVVSYLVRRMMTKIGKKVDREKERAKRQEAKQETTPKRARKTSSRKSWADIVSPVTADVRSPELSHPNPEDLMKLSPFVSHLPYSVDSSSCSKAAGERPASQMSYMSEEELQSSVNNLLIELDGPVFASVKPSQPPRAVVAEPAAIPVAAPIVNGPTTVPNPATTCASCHVTYRTARELQTHDMAVHKEVHVCTACNSKFDTKRMLDTHFKSKLHNHAVHVLKRMAEMLGQAVQPGYVDETALLPLTCVDSSISSERIKIARFPVVNQIMKHLKACVVVSGSAAQQPLSSQPADRETVHVSPPIWDSGISAGQQGVPLPGTPSHCYATPPSSGSGYGSAVLDCAAPWQAAGGTGFSGPVYHQSSGYSYDPSHHGGNTQSVVQPPSFRPSPAGYPPSVGGGGEFSPPHYPPAWNNRSRFPPPSTSHNYYPQSAGPDPYPQPGAHHPGYGFGGGPRGPSNEHQHQQQAMAGHQHPPMPPSFLSGSPSSHHHGQHMLPAPVMYPPGPGPVMRHPAQNHYPQPSPQQQSATAVSYEDAPQFCSL